MAESEHVNGDTTPIRVVDEYAELPGASRARYVLCDDGREYVIKGPSLVGADQSTVGGNEWIAARLAEAVGLPVLDHRIATMGGDLFFASAYMGKGTFYPEISPQLFDRCDNKSEIYGIVLFDAWLINRDRHNQNLIVRHLKRPEEVHRLLPNDHSHLLVSPSTPTSIGQLMGCLNEPPGRFVCLDFVRKSIVEPVLLRGALGRIEGLAEREIRAVVASTPVELLSVTEQGVYADFLVQRRDQLRQLLQNATKEFPNLKGPV